MRPLIVLGVVASLLCPASVFARSKPLHDLPGDVVRWSLCWMAIPQGIAEVARDDGPLAALAWGPSKGATTMIDSTTKEIWEAAKPDNRPGRREKSDVNGPVFRYDF